MLNPTERPALIDAIRALPDELSGVVEDLTDAQLDHQSVVDPWTIRKLVHHVADSHLNSFLRVKLLLTEEQPTPGGFSLGFLGPVNEGLVAWVVGMAALIGCAVWLGSKSS